MTLTFVDAGVLIAAARGNNKLSLKAMAVLDDPDRQFVSSKFVQLEVLPKAVFHKNLAEVNFYEIFFNSVHTWANSSEQLLEDAYAHACDYGLSAIDALHVAAAISVNADELVTTKKPDKPIHKTQKIKITSIT